MQRKGVAASIFPLVLYISGFLMTGAEVIMGREEVRGPIAAVTSWVLTVGNMGAVTRLTILNLQAMSLLNTPDSSASTCPPTYVSESKR